VSGNHVVPDTGVVRGVSPVPAGDEPSVARSALVCEARGLMAGVAVAISSARDRTRRGAAGLTESRTRLDASAESIRDWDVLRAELRAVVTALALEQRAANVTPEGMLVLVKATAEQAGVGDLEWPDERLVVADMVTWSIEAYFAA
jgi:hypothetical protein